MLQKVAEPAQLGLNACDFLCQFGKFEPTIQGAIIGATSALFAAVLTVAISAVVTALQLWHARLEREKDRSLEIKKDILLQMLDGIASSRTAINQFINFDIPMSDIQETFNQGNRIAQRAHGVASISIVSALQAYNEESAVSFIELMGRRIEVDVAKRKFDVAHNEMQKLADTHSDLAARHQALHISTNDDVSISDRILRAAKETQAKLDAIFAEVKVAGGAFDAVHTPFSSFCVETQLKLHPFVQKLTRLVRIEIGVDKAGSTEYLTASAVNVVRMRQTLRDAQNGASAVGP